MTSSDVESTIARITAQLAGLTAQLARITPDIAPAPVAAKTRKARSAARTLPATWTKESVRAFLDANYPRVNGTPDVFVNWMNVNGALINRSGHIIAKEQAIDPCGVRSLAPRFGETMTRIYSAQDDANYRAGLPGKRGPGRRSAAPVAPVAPASDAAKDVRRATQLATAQSILAAFRARKLSYETALLLMHKQIGTARSLELLAS